MPSTQRLPQPSGTTIQEPVGLALLRAWVRVEGEEDLVLEHLLTAAREKVEAYTGKFYAGSQRVAYTFELDEPYTLTSDYTVEGVTGFFDSVEALEAFDFVEYQKGIHINRELPLCLARAQTYTVTAVLPASTVCPEIVKSAILELAAEWYRNRESSNVGTISPELPVNFRVKLAEERAKPIAF